MIYFLHFNQQTQKFTIIETGATITPLIHGESVAMSEDFDKLNEAAKLLVIVGKKFGLKYTCLKLMQIFDSKVVKIEHKQGD